ncbi:MAG: hypothetical protein AAGF12_02555 [Myxococcota bacterium]
MALACGRTRVIENLAPPDGTVDLDGGTDAPIDAPTGTLTVVAPDARGANLVVLGIGESARVQVLGPNNRVDFDSPGPGPFTVSLVPELATQTVRTLVNFDGPTITFEPRFSASVSDPPPPVPPGQVNGNVTPAGVGPEILVRLFFDGRPAGQARVDPTLAFELEVDRNHPGVNLARLVALELSGDQIVAAGSVVLEDFQPTSATMTGVEIDNIFSSVLVANTRNVQRPESLSATLTYIFDGLGRVDGIRSEATTTGGPEPSFRVNIPSFDRSLNSGVDGRLEIGPRIFEGFGQETAQGALVGSVRSAPGVIEIEMLDPPEFTSPVGPQDAPAQVTPGFDIQFQNNGANGISELVLTRTPTPCESGRRWEVTLAEGLSSFTPFDLPTSTGITPLGDNERVDLELWTTQVSPEGVQTHALSRGAVRVGEGCPASELDGEYVFVGGDTECGLPPDVNTSLVIECGQAFYVQDIGDAALTGCARVEGDPTGFIFIGEGILSGVTAVPETYPIAGADGFELLGSPEVDGSFVGPLAEEPGVAPGLDGEQMTISHRIRFISEGGMLLTEEILPQQERAVISGSNYQDFVPSGFGPQNLRVGRVVGWDGMQGRIQFRNGRGVCAANSQGGTLLRTAFGYSVLTVARGIDTDDRDGDGATDDLIFIARTLDFPF